MMRPAVSRLMRALRVPALGLLLAAVGCLPAGTPAPLSVETPTPLPPERRAQGVIFISLPGARPDLAGRYMTDGAMPALARMAAAGAAAEYLQPVEPALDAPAQASLLTSASPRRTGVFADVYRPAGQPVGQSAAGADLAPGVEPIWRTAMRVGVRAATVGFAPGMLDAPAYRADLSVSAGTALAPAAQHVLKFAEAKDWKNLPASFSPPREARLLVAQGKEPAPAELFALAIDTTNDGKENYDTWLLCHRKVVDDSAVRLRVNEWATVVVDAMLQTAVAFKVTNADPSAFTVFQSALMINQAVPLSLARDVTARFGTIPAAPDAEALARNWIDEGTYLQMSERQTAWLGAVAQYVYRQYQPDLLAVRLTAALDAGRVLMLTQSRQPRFLDKGSFYASALRHGYEIADTGIGGLASAADFSRDAVVVASAYGLAPAHTTLNLNKLFADRGWLSLQRAPPPATAGGALDLAKTRAYAEANGGMAHIYLNLKGRDPGGSVEAGDVEKLTSDIVNALRDLRDPSDNAPVFARVLRKADLASAPGWQSDLAGDIVAQARPGYVISSARDRAAVFEPAATLGVAGYAADLPDMRGLLVAQGAGIRAGVRAPAARALDVAPTLAVLLHIAPSVAAEGKPLDTILKQP